MNLYKNKYVSWVIWRFILRNPKLRSRLTRLLVREEERDIHLFGSTLRINTIKEIGYLNAQKNVASNVVTRDEVASILNLSLLLEPRDTFVDIGANIGLYSGIIGRYKHIFPDIRFFAFEANPDTCARLRQSLKDLPITIECVALSDTPGVLEFCGGAVSGVFGQVNSASDFQSKDQTVSVPAKRLDDFDLPGDSLVLKIDVEGHEWEVLQGAEGLFAGQRIKAVYLDGFKNEGIPSFLEKRGFSPFDGRTLKAPPEQGFSVLWIRNDWVRGSRLPLQ